jgi:cytochrome oxidase Cu insertion factor (SCO1/SenC/PrrC family)
MKILIITLLISIFVQISSICKVYPDDRKSAVQAGMIKLNIKYPEAKGGKLELFVSTQNPVAEDVASNEFERFVAYDSGNGKFVFNFKISDKQIKTGVYIILNQIYNATEGTGRAPKNDRIITCPILDHYYLQNGDKLTITVVKTPNFVLSRSSENNFALQFAGKGFQKCVARYRVDSLKYNKDMTVDYSKPDSTYNENDSEMNTAKELLAFLRSYRNLNRQAYSELRIHAYFSTKWSESHGIRVYFPKSYRTAPKELLNRFKEDFDKDDTLRWATFDRATLKISYDFWHAEVEKYFAMSFMQELKGTPDGMISLLANIKDSDIREKLIILTIKSKWSTFRDINHSLKQSSKYILSKTGKAEFNEFYKDEAGQPAYNFELTDTSGKKVKLSDFKGKVVFIDFWYTGCVNCLNYYENVLSKVEEQFRSNQNFVFISISIDKDKVYWLKSVNKRKYTSVLATNLYTNGEGTLNNVIANYRIEVYPRPLIIDKNQKIFEMSESLREKNFLINALKLADK